MFQKFESALDLVSNALDNTAALVLCQFMIMLECEKKQVLTLALIFEITLVSQKKWENFKKTVKNCKDSGV